MLVDGTEVPRGSTINADICIIGGGPAGIAAAVPFLDRAGTSVVLLESGGLTFDEEVQSLSDGVGTGQPYFPLNECHLRTFGGSTLSWGGILTRLEEIDFQERAWVPRSGWPFARSELDGYYEQAMAASEVTPYLPPAILDEATGERRTPTAAVEWSEVYFSAPARFGKMYAEPIDASRSVAAYLWSTATALRMNESGTRVDTVDVSCLGGNSYQVSADYVILAGGGIENARLLLASPPRAGGGIGNRNDLVGRFFQEHPRVYDRYLLPDDHQALATFVHGAAGTLDFSRMGLTPAVQRSEELLNYLANIAFGYAGQETDQFVAMRRMVNAVRSPWSDSPYMQDRDGGPNKVRWEDIKTALRRPHRSVQSVIGAGFEPARMRRWIEIESNVEQLAVPDNRITLTDEVDALGMPKSQVHWSVSPEEERTYRRGVELVVEALDQQAPGLKDRKMEYPDPWPDTIQGCWHHMGTTRMNNDPSKGVVDSDCKAHDVDNLYVAGSSVFPTGGAGSPTLTIVALAFRLSDHLKARLAADASTV